MRFIMILYVSVESITGHIILKKVFKFLKKCNLQLFILAQYSFVFLDDFIDHQEDSVLSALSFTNNLVPLQTMFDDNQVLIFSIKLIFKIWAFC